MAAENPYLDGLFKLIVGTRWAPSSYHSGLSIYFRPCRFGLFHPIQKKIVGAHLVTSSNRIKGTSSRPGAPKMIMTNIRFQPWMFDSKSTELEFWIPRQPNLACPWKIHAQNRWYTHMIYTMFILSTPKQNMLVTHRCIFTTIFLDISANVSLCPLPMGSGHISSELKPSPPKDKHRKHTNRPCLALGQSLGHALLGCRGSFESCWFLRRYFFCCL